MVFAILLSIFSISSSYTVLANEKLDDPIEMFEALVIQTDEYKLHKSNIIQTEVKTIVDTELKERITISYLVENEENRLVFVGDKDLNFLFIGYLSNENNQQKLVEYLDDRVTTMNVPPIPRHIDPNCASYYCSKTENSYYYNPQPGCSFVVGQACSPLLIAPVPGARILFLLCKAGVFVGCNVAKEKVCVQGTWFPVCER